MAGKEDLAEKLLIPGGPERLHDPKEDVDGVSSGLRTLALEKEEGADAKEEQDDGKLTAADDALPLAAAVDGEEDDSEEINWVEMPQEHVLWILAKKRESDPVPTLEDFGLYTQEDIDREDADGLIRKSIASLQAAQDDFFEYQAWVREIFTNNGRVMVPESVLGPKDQLQKAYKRDGDAESDTRAADSISEEEALPSK